MNRRKKGFAVLPLVLSREPILPSRDMRFQIICTTLRECARRFRRISRPHRPEIPICLIESVIAREAGSQIIAAVKLGAFSAIADFSELVRFHESPTPSDSGRQAVWVHCPGNLFIDVVGGNLVTAFNGPDGVVATSGCHGGLLARIVPDLFPEYPIDAHDEFVERQARGCDVLADLIERDSSRHGGLAGERQPARRPVRGLEKWRRDQSKLLRLALASHLPESIRKAAERIGCGFESARTAVHRSALLSAHFETPGSVSEGVYENLINDLPPPRQFGSLTPEQSRGFDRWWRDMTLARRRDFVQLLIANPNAIMRQTCQLIENKDR